MSETFVDAVMAGRSHWTDIDDWVERWHDGTDQRDLRGFLGLSDDEYVVWVHEPSALRLILLARETGRPMASLLTEQDEIAVAARNFDPTTTDQLLQWLRETGRLPH